MFTKKQRRDIRDAFKSLTYFEDQMEPLLNDPMTAAMGAPVGDFAESWEKKARGLQAKSLEKLRNVPGTERLRDCLIDSLTAHI